ncbi:hypothetical protein GCM10023094_50330 [Rhodococcus olei]|uniref:Uncharacterized protein n=1 Tax=Rhodococcus olei TaxID=2161675 RepID=A0ABP8PL65_9NOCA
MRTQSAGAVLEARAAAKITAGGGNLPQQQPRSAQESPSTVTFSPTIRGVSPPQSITRKHVDRAAEPRFTGSIQTTIGGT